MGNEQSQADGEDPPGHFDLSRRVQAAFDRILRRRGLEIQDDDAASRWNKIDGNRHSLLDFRKHISAYGKTGQEPSLIMINYGTNDALHKSNPSDTFTSIVQSLTALRTSAPDAQIIVIIPFGQYYARELRETVEIHRKAHPVDARIAITDLGPSVARTFAAKNGLLGGLHPKDRGHAILAAKIIPQVMAILDSGPK